MFDGIGKTLLVAVPVALLSAAVMYWRGGGPDRAPLTYAIAALVGGFVAKGVYTWMVGRWPTDAASLYLWLAVGLAVALSVLAFVGQRLWKTGDALGFTLINFLWAIGFGWVLPRLVG